MNRIQEAPFAVQIELSEGCNLYCDFCGLQGIRTIKEKNFKFMTPDTAKSLARQMRDAGWNARIEAAMHGEPTMNPDYIRIIKIFRKYLPKAQLMMTSNGGGLLRPPGILESLTNLFDAGLNIFAFDAYEYVKIKDKIDEVLFNRTEALSFEVHRYPDELEISPHRRYPLSTRKFIRVKDISIAEKGSHSSLNNHCGSGSAGLKEPLSARCAKPFRELSVRWNGDVAVCCNDWRGIYQCGNVVTDGLLAVWDGSPMRVARRFLIKGDRASLKPCNICDAKSYRVGLLPDKKGKETLREPNEKDARLAEKYSSSGTLTEVVVRPWEIKKRAKK